MDKYGNIYLGFDTLISIDYTGNLRWEYDLEGNTWISSAIVIDQNNNIYFTINNNQSQEILAFNSDGELLWKLAYPYTLHYPDNYYGFAIGFQRLFFPGFMAQIISSIK